MYTRRCFAESFQGSMTFLKMAMLTAKFYTDCHGHGLTQLAGFSNYCVSRAVNALSSMDMVALRLREGVLIFDCSISWSLSCVCWMSIP